MQEQDGHCSSSLVLQDGQPQGPDLLYFRQYPPASSENDDDVIVPQIGHSNLMIKNLSCSSRDI